MISAILAVTSLSKTWHAFAARILRDGFIISDPSTFRLLASVRNAIQLTTQVETDQATAQIEEASWSRRSQSCGR